MGQSNAKLSYYDGMIQLSYKNGTPYNNDKHTPRATLITFLCDRDVGVGVPEYQVGMCRACARGLGSDAHLMKAGEGKKVLVTGLVTFLD